RAQKVANAAKLLPPQQVIGPQSGELLVLSWGGTYGACLTAVQQAQKEGISVALAHIRYLNPFPSNLGEILSRYEKVLIPELNMGQLRMLIRSRYLVDAVGYNKVKGKPFAVSELVEKITEMTKSANHKTAQSLAS
ncbi:MAG: 2-oxoglutarate ferredoxin oxidoreductase subunit alpha, partial [Pirellula sp.]